MRWLADMGYGLAAVLYAPIALYNALVLGKNRRGWGQRLGFVPPRDPSKSRIWIHAVSVGEVNATPRLAALLRERLPDCEIVVSTTTDTGYARAVGLYGSNSVFRFPLDFSLVIARVFRRVRPSMIILVELEVWYNLTRLADRRGVPVVVVNGRLTERSAERFAKLGAFARSMFGCLSWVGAQDEPIAARFRGIGVAPARVEVTSSLKWDSATVADRVQGDEALAKALGFDEVHSLWVCGSTGPGEEAQILEAYKYLRLNAGRSEQASPADKNADRHAAHPVLVIVPRKPERFNEVAALIERSGFACIRRSRHPDGGTVARLPEGAVALGDTMGELRKFYALADVVFVGRSLVPMGGSDPMEVAALGKPMIVGPHTDNFALPVAVLKAAKAVRIVASSAELASTVGELLADKPLAEALGARGREVVLQNQGATDRTVDRIVSIMQRSLSGSPLPKASGVAPGLSSEGG